MKHRQMNKKYLFFIIILIFLIFSFILVNRKIYGVWNPLSSPIRVQCYNRTYNFSSNTNSVQLNGTEKPKYEIPQSFMDSLTGKKLYMSHPKGEFVPTVIYLMSNNDKYYTFELSGGP